MTRTKLFTIGMMVVLTRPCAGQARVVSAPAEPSLLNLTSSWSRASSLGDLRAMRTPSDHLELRVWRGYSSSETQAVVLRRTDGHWSAFVARIIRCEIQIPKSVGDTASAATMRGFVAEARRRCGTSVTDVSAGSRLIATDTVVVQQLDVPEMEIETAWRDVLDVGVHQLPGRIDRSMKGDGTMYVVELRRGDEYRAAEIEHLEVAEVKADSVVQHVYAAVRRLLPR